MRDFTLKIYYLLLTELKKRQYNFITFQQYMANKIVSKNFQSIVSDNMKQMIESGNIFSDNYPICILRHDVDRLPENSLSTAQIEYNMNIKGSYYFRVVPESYDERIIKKIASLGHEIGYHYEDVDTIIRSHKLKFQNNKGEIDNNKLIDLAYEKFCNNLEMFRRDFDIKSICMHGSPRSRYDNKIIWTKYNYKALRLIGEPYLDLDWNEFGYFTDTGRKWNGNGSNIRDKVISKYKFEYKSTGDIIEHINKLPQKIMLTIHPQRWNNELFTWSIEYFSQNAKNLIKKYFYLKKVPTSV